ncbi:MAG: cache domain-containing protein, partial [Rhodospirillaceae bacterium]
MVILVAASLITLNQKMTTLAQDKVNTLVEAGTSIVEKFVDSAESGAMDTELAQTTALAALASARFDGNDYFFVLDRDVTLVMHGAKPELNGQNFTGFTDQNGTLLFKDLVAQASSGGGYVNYVWPRAGSTDPVAKISYASPLNDWGWTIVTGVYVDDISAA